MKENVNEFLKIEINSKKLNKTLILESYKCEKFLWEIDLLGLLQNKIKINNFKIGHYRELKSLVKGKNTQVWFTTN